MADTQPRLRWQVPAITLLILAALGVLVLGVGFVFVKLYAPPERPERGWGLRYFDTNHGGQVDVASYDDGGYDGGWTKYDTDYDGRFDWSTVYNETIDEPVPTGVAITSSPYGTGTMPHPTAEERAEADARGRQ